MNNEHAKMFLSPVFVITLCLLLLNDFLLKPIFHNWLTGKLSDFAGLFVFPLFLFALCPRYKKAIYALTAFLFCCWKSAYSQPLIDAWNAFSILPVSRVADSSDIIALLVLPFSYRYSDFKQQCYSPRFAALPIALLAIFAFAATSFHTEIEYTKDYQFEESKIELTRKVYHLSDLNRSYTVTTCESDRPAATTIKIDIPSDFCFGRVVATIVIGETEGKGTITLKKIEHQCPKGEDQQQRLLAIFEKEFINKIREVNLGSAPGSTIASATGSSDRSPLVRAGPLYFVAIGELPEVNIKDLARDLNAKHRLSIKILPTIPLTDDLRAPGFPTSRPISERLVEAMKQKHADIARDPTAIIVGITEDMNVSGSNRVYEINYRSAGRFAVVAVDSLNPTTFCEPANRNLLESRLQKVIAGHIGALCYRLGPSDSPRSVLYRSTGCVHELDAMGTDF